MGWWPASGRSLDSHQSERIHVHHLSPPSSQYSTNPIGSRRSLWCELARGYSSIGHFGDVCLTQETECRWSERHVTHRVLTAVLGSCLRSVGSRPPSAQHPSCMR